TRTTGARFAPLAYVLVEIGLVHVAIADGPWQLRQRWRQENVERCDGGGRPPVVTHHFSGVWSHSGWPPIGGACMNPVGIRAPNLDDQEGLREGSEPGSPTSPAREVAAEYADRLIATVGVKLPPGGARTSIPGERPPRRG